MKYEYNQILLGKEVSSLKRDKEFSIIHDTFFTFEDLVDDLMKLKTYLIYLSKHKNENDIVVRYDILDSDDKLCIYASFLFALEELLVKLEMKNKLVFHGREVLETKINKILVTDIIRILEIPIKEVIFY